MYVSWIHVSSCHLFSNFIYPHLIHCTLCCLWPLLFSLVVLALFSFVFVSCFFSMRLAYSFLFLIVPEYLITYNCGRKKYMYNMSGAILKYVRGTFSTVTPYLRMLLHLSLLCSTWPLPSRRAENVVPHLSLLCCAVFSCWASQFVASAVQHAGRVRKKVYDVIDWGLDHPVLLEIKYRFNAVSTRVSEGCRCFTVGVVVGSTCIVTVAATATVQYSLLSPLLLTLSCYR